MATATAVHSAPKLSGVTLTLSLAEAQDLCAFLQSASVGANARSVYGSTYSPIAEVIGFGSWNTSAYPELVRAPR